MLNYRNHIWQFPLRYCYCYKRVLNYFCIPALPSPHIFMFNEESNFYINFSIKNHKVFDVIYINQIYKMWKKYCKIEFVLVNAFTELSYKLLRSAITSALKYWWLRDGVRATVKSQPFSNHTVLQILQKFTLSKISWNQNGS